MIECFLESTQATEAFGGRLAKVLARDCVTYLRGELGTGKTTLVRGFLRAHGYQGSVKSPTYTLLEPYLIDDIPLIHLDLYRLVDPSEIEFIGLQDLLTEQAILLVEWPERGQGLLPEPDLMVVLDYKGNGRQCRLTATSKRGEAILKGF
jgi:tRNA threonylcarbamoyladenosine biosynthesis protein TsaE